MEDDYDDDDDDDEDDDDDDEESSIETGKLCQRANNGFTSQWRRQTWMANAVLSS